MTSIDTTQNQPQKHGRPSKRRSTPTLRQRMLAGMRVTGAWKLVKP